MDNSKKYTITLEKKEEYKILRPYTHFYLHWWNFKIHL